MKVNPYFSKNKLIRECPICHFKRFHLFLFCKCPEPDYFLLPLIERQKQEEKRRIQTTTGGEV